MLPAASPGGALRRIPCPPTSDQERQGASGKRASGIPSPRAAASACMDKSRNAASTATLHKPGHGSSLLFSKVSGLKPLDLKPLDRMNRSNSVDNMDDVVENRDVRRARIKDASCGATTAGPTLACGQLLKPSLAFPSKASGTASLTYLSSSSSANPTTGAARSLSPAANKPASFKRAPVLHTAPIAQVAAPAAAVLPRSVSVDKSRLPGDTRSSFLRRARSVGKARDSRGGGMAPDQPVTSTSSRCQVNVPARRPYSAALAKSSGRPVSSTSTQSAGDKMQPSWVPTASGGAANQHKAQLKSILEAKPRPPRTAFSKPEHAAPVLKPPIPAPTSPILAVAAPSPAPVVPSKPGFALNLSSILKQQALQQQLQQPTPKAQDQDGPSAADDEATPPVPKLDLGGILQQRADEQQGEEIYKPAAEEDSQGKRMSVQQEEAREHYYLYPKVNPQEKKKVEDMLKALPSKQQKNVQEIFNKMVEARQNCEQMIFRGHRLLDQAQVEYKNRIAREQEEKERERQEKERYRQEVDLLRSQLAYVLTMKQQQEAAAAAASHQTQTSQQMALAGVHYGHKELTPTRSSVLLAFDQMQGNLAELPSGTGEPAGEIEPLQLSWGDEADDPAAGSRVAQE